MAERPPRTTTFRQRFTSTFRGISSSFFSMRKTDCDGSGRTSINLAAEAFGARKGKGTWPSGVLHPNGKFRHYWDIYVAILLSYIAVVAPVHACFMDVSPVWAQRVDVVIDMSFSIDIMVSFNTAYAVKDKYITSRKKIASKYLTSWFIIDFVSVFPFQIIFSHSSFIDELNTLAKLPRLLRVLKMLRLLKLFRAARLKSLIRRLENVYGIHVGVSRLLRLLGWIIFVNHFLSCFWFFIPNFGGKPSPKSWVSLQNLEEASLTEKYVSSAYWVFSSLTTVGYGDITGETQEERIYSIFVMAIGVTWYAFIVSSISSIMASFDTYNRRMRSQLLKLNNFCRDSRLPRDLANRLREHLEQAMTDKSNYYEADEILTDMPAILRLEVLEYMYRHMINDIPYLKDKTPQFRVRLVVALRPLLVQANELIIEEGTYADEMYFLTQGKAKAVKGGVEIGILPPGSSFGEAGCILNDIRHASIVAVTNCELYTLLKHDMFQIMAEFPQFAKSVRAKAIDKVKSMSTNNSKNNLGGILGQTSSPRKYSLSRRPSKLDRCSSVSSDKISIDQKLVAFEQQVMMRIDTMVESMNDALGLLEKHSKCSEIPN